MQNLVSLSVGLLLKQEENLIRIEIINEEMSVAAIIVVVLFILIAIFTIHSFFILQLIFFLFLVV